MHLQPTTRKHLNQGYALIMALGFTALAVFLLASLGSRVFNSAALTARNNNYNSTAAAAESATEVVIAQMSRDFLHQSFSASMNTYNSVLPGTLISGGWPANFQFSDGLGNTNNPEQA